MQLDPLPTELRPTSELLKYYALTSLLAGPFFFVPLIPLFARYRSLRYRIDHEGLSMRWGILFQREVSLNYARIQDIHLTSNVVERWLGLGKIQVQTASASAKAEMTIEGLPDLGGMRDFLYDRMRGARGELPRSGAAGRASRGGAAEAGAGEASGVAAGAAGGSAGDELTATLRQVAAELRALRTALGEEGDPRRPSPSRGTRPASDEEEPHA